MAASQSNDTPTIEGSGISFATGSINNYGSIEAAGGRGASYGAAPGEPAGMGGIGINGNIIFTNQAGAVLQAVGGQGGPGYGAVTGGTGGAAAWLTPSGRPEHRYMDNYGTIIALGGAPGLSDYSQGGIGGSGLKLEGQINNLAGASIVAKGSDGEDSDNPTLLGAHGGIGLEIQSFNNQSGMTGENGIFAAMASLQTISSGLDVDNLPAGLEGLPAGIIAMGGNGGSGINADGGYGIYQQMPEDGGFVNQGLLLVTGGDGGTGVDARGGYGYWLTDSTGQQYRTFSNQGLIFATGGDRDTNAYGGLGMYMQSNLLNQGFIYGSGSTVPRNGTIYTGDGTGLYVDGTLVNQGTLAFEGYNGIIVGNSEAQTTALTLQAGSALMPILSLDNEVNGNAEITPGRIYAFGNIQIEPGARLQPVVSMALPNVGDTLESVVFMGASGGHIEGEFELPDATIEYSTNKETNESGINVMQLNAIRRYFPSQLASEHNSASLAAFAQNIATDPKLLEQIETLNDLDELTPQQLDMLNAYYNWSALHLELDSQFDRADIGNKADEMARTSTPQASSQLFNMGVRQMRAAATTFSQQLQAANNLPLAPVQNAAAGEADYNSFLTWVKPFHHTGRQDASSNAYTDLNQHFSGISFGGAANLGQLTLGLGVHYIHGKMDGGGYDAKSNSIGFMLGLGRHFAVSDNFNPWLEAHGGYTYQDIDQNRNDYYGGYHSSSPDADLFNLGLMANNDFKVTECLTLTPRIGLDYTRINMDSYQENGGPTALAVDPDDFDSLVANVGLKAGWQVSQGVELEGRAYYYYEFMDTDTDLNSRVPALPGHGFVAKGQDLNGHTAQVGLGINLSPTEDFSFGLGYDLWLADDYVGHQVEASFKLRF